MFQSDIGPLDGDSWEKLIQSVFKLKYDSYQDMVASPGDLGIEGFVLDEGILIQCYCPDENYDTKTLYEKQRDKMTEDLKKLSKNQKEIVSHLGSAKISQWIFITPKISKHDLHAHARSKTEEILSLGLPFIAEDFKVLIKDLDAYIFYIRHLEHLAGKQICFTPPQGESIPEPALTTKYDENINDKNEIRSVVKGVYKESVHIKLNDITKKQYLEGYDILRRIFSQSPELYERISKLVNNFEDDVETLSLTWQGDDPQELISSLENKLLERFKQSSYISAIESEDLWSITRHMIARWIAECPMRIE
ncbi:hypothetical protein KW477_05785 [Vibrio fluvialis]|nr:hypothetical protein [Vibrio fluvialis]